MTERTRTFMLLGVRLSDSLDWGPYVEHLLNRCSQRLYLLVLLERVGVADQDTSEFIQPWSAQCWSMLARSGTLPSQKNNRANWRLFSEERSVSCAQTSHIARHCRCLECRRYTNFGRTFAVLSVGTWCDSITNYTTCCQPEDLLDMDSGTKPSTTAYPARASATKRPWSPTGWFTGSDF